MKADAETESGVRKTISEMAERYENRDIEGMLASFAPREDVTLIGTGADEYRRGPKDVESQWTRDWSQTEAVAIRLSDLSVSASGDVAWADAAGSFEIAAGGQQSSLPARATFVLERGNGGWRIVQAHFSTPSRGQETGSSIPD